MNPLNAKVVFGKVQAAQQALTMFIDAWYPVVTATSPRIAVIQCGGCGEDFVAHIDPSDPRSLWPLDQPEIPVDVPPKVAAAYHDACLALAAGSKIGALMAGRTTIVRLLREQKASKLSDLVQQGLLTSSLSGAADNLRLWAGVLGHEDVEDEGLEVEDVQDILDYLLTILEAIYTHPA